MTKNEKMQQIISNIQVLSELTNKIKDSEFYPVSFFSKTFDLIQKIQSDIHTLEAEQVKVFETQMKKHQALMLSIHQQMQTIEGKNNDTSISKVSTVQPSSKIEVPKKIATETNKLKVVETATNTPLKTECESKKVSFFSRLTHKGKDKTDNPEKGENIAGITSQPIAKKTELFEKPTTIKKVSIIENPIVVPKKVETNVSEQTNEIEKEPIVPRKATTVEKMILESAQVKICSTVSKIEQGKTKAVIEQTVSNPKPTIKDIIESKVPVLEQSGVAAEGGAPPSINDVIEKKKLSDLRKAFSLNDRFRYRRELFSGNEDTMNKIITAINHKESYEESLKYLEEKLHWDFSDPTVKEFVKILEMRFL